MKRDMNVIVELLLRLEAEEAGLNQWHPRVDGISGAVVEEHLVLMQEAGLVDFELRQAVSGRRSLVHPRLTNGGHDFLETMRTPERRSRVARWAKAIGQAVTIDLVLAYIKAVVTE